jgi:hypothetical protein
MSLSPFGKKLYRMLPSLYRERDNGDLASYLEACGLLFDQVYQTLVQRLADLFPDSPEQGLECQEWLLPYFAQLLDVRIRSPLRDGRQEEVSRAVALRQAKGTLACAEQVAQIVGALEIELEEGWKRLAMTPRLGLPLLPARYFGCASEPDPLSPSLLARHPGLPAVTVDLRFGSRALAFPAGRPCSRTTSFDGRRTAWRQAAPHGRPCFPGSYEDASRRTPDLRSPSWRQGHFHPRRLLCHFPPHEGFFPATDDATELRPADWEKPEAVFTWQTAGLDGSAFRGFFPLAAEDGILARNSRAILVLEPEGEEPLQLPVTVSEVEDDGVLLIGPAPAAGGPVTVPAAGARLRPRRSLTIPWNRRHDACYCEFFAESDARVQLDGRDFPARRFRNRTLDTPWYLPLSLRGAVELTTEDFSCFEGINLDNRLRITAGRVKISQGAVRYVEVLTVDTETPVLMADNCLFKRIQAARGLSRLEYCTVLEQTLSEGLQASDCLFLGILRRHHQPLFPPAAGCLRFSRLIPEQNTKGLRVFRCTREPVSCHSLEFGERGCGVLHPATAGAIRCGAEDGGEMGAFHARRYTLREAAVLEKLKDFLPLGLEAVLIPDPRLLVAPG